MGLSEKNKLEDFLREHKDEINNYDFATVFEQINAELSKYFATLLYNNNIDPLKYMKTRAVPAYFEAENENLKTIEIPWGIEVIKSSAFQSCTSLESITLPHTLKDIKAFAFYHCDSLKVVYYHGTKEEAASLSEAADIANFDLFDADWYYEGEF